MEFRYEINEKIASSVTKLLYGKQVVVFLGSGASVKHIQSTSEVTKSLKNWTKYYMPRSSYSSKPMEALDFDGNSGQIRYFEKLYNDLSVHFSNPSSFLHFERLIHIAQSLDYHTRSVAKGDNDFLKVGSGPLTAIDSAYVGLDNQIHNFVASQATNFILDQISIRETDKAKELDLRNDSLNSFLRGVSDRAYVRLFTLNYDTLPLHSGISFATGYKKTDSRSRAESFFPNEILHSYRQHLFCQLHGSCLFGYSAGDSSSSRCPLGNPQLS